jgi:hypothetical protein
MPFLSAFTPLGLLKCSSAPSYAEQFYRAQVDAYGGQYRLDEGDHMEATIYARSIVLGLTKRILEHAGDQVNPQKAMECLEYREDEYGSIPSPNASLAERRQLLSYLRRLPVGNTQGMLLTIFREVLGDAFVTIRATPSTDIFGFPSLATDSPNNFQPVEVEGKNIQMLDAVSLAGSSTVRYDGLDPDEPREGATTLPRTMLIVGDVLVVDTGNNIRVERVTVTDIGTTTVDGTEYRTFSATFANAHDAGTAGTTANFPYWVSTKRHSLVVLSDDAILDAEVRRKTHEWCARLLRAVSTWSIVGQSAAGVLGPWKVDEGMIDVTTIGTITL